MKLISYVTKSDSTAENRARIEGVFAALAAEAPAGLSYTVLEVEDGRFLHVFDADSEAARGQMREMPAFREFLDRLDDRQVAPSTTQEVRIVGSYGKPLQP